MTARAGAPAAPAQMRFPRRAPSRIVHIPGTSQFLRYHNRVQPPSLPLLRRANEVVHVFALLLHGDTRLPFDLSEILLDAYEIGSPLNFHFARQLSEAQGHLALL